MSELVEFLEARLAEDERLASRAASLCGCHPPAPDWRFDGDEADGRIEVEADGHLDVRPRAALNRRWNQSYRDYHAAEHIVRHDPARALRDVEAKRQILAEHAPRTVMVMGGDGRGYPGAYCGMCSPADPNYRQRHPCRTLRLLASRWSDHPDYLPEWSPETVVPGP